MGAVGTAETAAFEKGAMLVHSFEFGEQQDYHYILSAKVMTELFRAVVD